MAYNRRTKMLAAAKRQMEEDGVEFSNADLKWRADDVYAQGVRSPCKTQKNEVNQMRRDQHRLIQNETVRKHNEHGLDYDGKDWTPIVPGSLVQLVKDDWRSGGSKDDLATVVKEFKSEGKRWVEVLLGSQVVTISKGSIKEL